MNTERMSVAFENPCTIIFRREERAEQTFQRSLDTMLCRSCESDRCLLEEGYAGFACLS